MSDVILWQSSNFPYMPLSLQVKEYTCWCFVKR